MEQGEMGAMASDPLMTDQQAAQLAKIMLAVLFLAVFFWATEALPLGATDLLVAVMLYLFCILPINEISKAYMKDAVFFIFGILAVAVGVAKTGLDKRIGLILLSRIKSAKAFAFIFLPLLAMSASAAR
jgi:sodium-dependent dicarboxylate transporter 2/3/5